jgi:hypothetical protein
MHAHRWPRHDGPATCFRQGCVQGAHLMSGTNACIDTGNDTRRPSRATERCRVKRTTQGKTSLTLPLRALGAHAAVRHVPPQSRPQPGLHVTHGARPRACAGARGGGPHVALVVHDPGRQPVVRRRGRGGRHGPAVRQRLARAAVVHHLAAHLARLRVHPRALRRGAGSLRTGRNQRGSV